MKRISKPTLAILAVLLAAFAGLFMLSPNWLQSNQGMVVIAGNTPGALAVAHRTGAPNPAKQLELIIGLKLRHPQALDALLHELHNPQSTNFRKFLTPDEFVKDYAPTQSDVDKVVRFLKGHGLTILEIAPNRLYVRVSGTIQQIQTVFSINISSYTVGGRQVYSNDRNPSIPAGLKDVVQGVIGLDSISVYHSRMVHGSAAPPSSSAASVPYGYGPADLSTAYDYPLPSNRKGGVIHDGRGATIAIATAYNYLDSDVQAYWQYYGIARSGTVTNIYPNGRNTQPDDETTLDLQQMGALAPGADIRMYEGHDPEVSSFVAVYNRIVIDNKATVATTSWGLCEADTAPAELSTEDNIFAEGEAQGILFLAAAGDDGANDCQTKVPTLAVDFPASDPHVVAVGGTTLLLFKSSGARFDEQAWPGAGGGVSIIFEHPDWQFGPGVPNDKMRDSSDIAVNADPETGDSTFFLGKWDEAGGTSFATPDLGALFGDAVAASGGRLGNIGPALYRILRSQQYHQVFFDVTVGSNDDYNGPKFPGYPATPGYDHPTGVGTPDGEALINWLIVDQEHSANPGGTPLNQAVPLSVPAPDGQ